MNKKLGRNYSKKIVDEVIKVLSDLSKKEFVSGSNLFYDDFQNIINRLEDDSFRLAIVGEFSSGKSTFLNALIGKDILKHGAQETTATITEIHNCINADGRDVFDVYFENGDIEENIDIENLTEYTATSSKSHSVALEIEKVVIRSNVMNSNENVCFVDTPGLNGVADNHREKTIDQIKNSHACIYLLQVRGLGQSDIEFLKFICKYQHNIIFVQNFIDELKELEGETVEEKLKEQSIILREKVFNDIDYVSYGIVGISARKALISRDLRINQFEGVGLDDGLRKRLYEESRFDTVLEEISKLMVNNERGYIQKRDSVIVGLELLEQLMDVVSFQNEQEREAWSNSAEGRKQKSYERIKEELKNNKEKYYANIDNFVESESSDIRKFINKHINTSLKKLYDCVERNMEKHNTLIEFEEYLNREELPQMLYDNIMEIENQGNKYMNASFEKLLCNAILRIKQYTGDRAEKIEATEFVVDEFHSPENLFRFEQEENEIAVLNREVAEKKAQLESERNKRISVETDIRRIDAEIRNNSDKIISVEKKKIDAIKGMGEQPEAVTKYRTETYEEYRGGFGILDALFGPKIRTRSVPYLDDSEQKRWLKKKSDVEYAYKKEEDMIKAEGRLLMDKAKRLKEDIIHLDKLEPIRQKALMDAQKLLESKIAFVEVKREKAQKEYLNNLKNALLINVEAYLQGNVKECLIENFEKAVLVNKQRITDITLKIFIMSFEERIATIDRIINNKINKDVVLKTDELLKEIRSAKKVLEVFVQ